MEQFTARTRLEGMSSSPAIVWFRQDLRLHDNPALAHALAVRRPVLPVFIWDPDEEGEWAPGAASRWWLHHSLVALDETLQRLRSRLIIRHGAALDELRKLTYETKAGLVVWNRRYEPAAIGRDTAVKQALLDDALDVHSFNGALLFSPLAVQTQTGGPFQVFTPFWNHCRLQTVRDEISFTAGVLPTPDRWPESESIDALALKRAVTGDRAFHDHWQPGETGAQSALATFLAKEASDYAIERELPAQHGTSRLSPHLRWGEISPVQIHHAVRRAGDSNGAQIFMSEVAWREFAAHLLFHFPHTTTEPLRPEFAHFPWQKDDALLRAWQRGETGYPLVDAGMRELWGTGWMHNRVRMVASSLLVKHFLQPWQEGARWFWDTLVDADLASNTLGWQWSTGCGADAAPYFRIFSPIVQGAKFDPVGEYVKRWLPELGRLPAKFIHAPWDAPESVLSDAGVRLGATYPRPVIEHSQGRNRALAAYQQLRRDQ